MLTKLGLRYKSNWKLEGKNPLDVKTRKPLVAVQFPLKATMSKTTKASIDPNLVFQRALSLSSSSDISLSQRSV